MRTQDFDVESFEQEVLSNLNILLTPTVHIGYEVRNSGETSIRPIDDMILYHHRPKSRDVDTDSEASHLKPRRLSKETSYPHKRDLHLKDELPIFSRSTAFSTHKSTNTLTKSIVIKRKSLELTPKAQRIVNRKSVKKYLCPALKSVSDDAFEIAKVVIPVLAPLSQSLKIPLESV